MKALREEFSVVAELQRSRSKSWVVIAAVVAVAAAVVVAVVLLSGRDAEPGGEGAVAYVAPGQELVYEERKLYDTPEETPPEAAVEAGAEAAPLEPLPAVKAVQKAAIKAPRARTNAPEVATPPPPSAKGDRVFRKMTAAEFEALTTDAAGKGEVKIQFDADANARAARAEADEKRAARSNARGQEVNAAFGKKKRQFASCADGAQERVRVLFTVEPGGRVTGVEIQDTASDVKSACLQRILGRSVFPRGDTAQTYSQILVL